MPNGCYRTADGAWLAVSCRNDDDWARLVEGGRSQTIDVADHTSKPGPRGSAEVDGIVGRWAATVTADAGQELLQRAGVPAGKIQDAG